MEHLKRHMRSHTKEKPFLCPSCAKGFSRKDLLLRHARKLHEPLASSSKLRGACRLSTVIFPTDITGPSSVTGRTWETTVAKSMHEAADSNKKRKTHQVYHVSLVDSMVSN